MNSRFARYLSIIFVVASSTAGCSATKPLQNPATDATLWMENSAEYKALTTTVYQAAASKLPRMLNDSSETAALEQGNGAYRKLPPAIILDVDETILNNAPFQARLIRQNAHYSSKRWDQWVREEKAGAIAGAVAFTREAAKKGITVFYVTNRNAKVKQATYQNLKKLGFPLKKEKNVLLMKNGQPGWTSSKVNRRKYVAKNYRILMLFGDNLNDFLPATGITEQRRHTLIKKYHERFGNSWFVLPNPVYGSWQQALYDFNNSLSPKQIRRKKLEKLGTKEE